jgi:hypothetical protein
VTMAVRAVDPATFPPGEAPGWTRAALIRPDAVIAWRPDAPAGEAAGRLVDVMAELLADRPAPAPPPAGVLA